MNTSQETYRASKYRIVDEDGDEVICGECNRALLQGRKKRKWAYNKDHDQIQREQFHRSLKCFPDKICTICHRLLFHYSVSKFVECEYDEDKTFVNQCLQKGSRMISSDGVEYICKTCSMGLLTKENFPFQAVANQLHLTHQPDILKRLNTLERRCISLNIPFMHIQSVRQRGKKMKGPCVNVPVKMEPICTLLPRIPENMETILLQLKRRLEYSRSYLYDYIRPNFVWTALLWLKAHNPLYKDVQLNEKWFEELEKSDMFDVVDDNFDSDSDCGNDPNFESDAEEKKEESKTDDDNVGEEETVESDVDLEEEQAFQKQKAKLSVEPLSTCVQYDQIDEAVFAIAPGEQSKPNYILLDEQFEVKCFPDFFPLGQGSFHCPERPNPILMRRYVNQRLLNADPRFARKKEYIFSMQYAVELKQLECNKSVYIRNHSFSGSDQAMNASMMRDSSFVHDLVNKDSAYKFMRTVRGTPAYWQGQLFETLAMFNALGKPTWFLTLSAAEHLWPEMMQAIGLTYGEKYTEEDIANMSHAKKSQLLRRNPVTTVRMWKHRLEGFFDIYIKNGKAAPIGKVVDFVIKIEFQARGSPHAHCLLWVEDSPQIDIDNDQDVCEFINQYCSGCIIEDWNNAPLDTTCDELEAIVRRVQVHKHNPMCRANKKAKCRHSFPKIPSFQTVITRPDLHLDLTEEERKRNAEIFSAVWKEIEEDGSKSLKEICEKCSIDCEEYMKAVVTSDTSRTVVLKREPKDLFVNNYNGHILTLWKANMDIQYCGDKYQVVNYVMNYVMKSEKGLSELMLRVREKFKHEGIRKQMQEVIKNIFRKT